MDKITEEQANVVPNKTIASRLREVHGTTGETVATAIPGAGPVMYVDAEFSLTNEYVLAKTFNEIKQAIDNNIFVVIKRKESTPGSAIVYIEHVCQVIIDKVRGIFGVRAIVDGRENPLTVEYNTVDSSGYPTRPAT